MKTIILYRSDFVMRDGESAFDDLFVSLGLEVGSVNEVEVTFKGI